MSESEPTAARTSKPAVRLLVWAALVTLFFAAVIALGVAVLGPPLLMHARPHRVTTAVQTPPQEAPPHPPH
jgi:hypothetical protein